MLKKFSAVVEFSIFVLHAFLIGNYSIEKNSSDVIDQFQLRYLAMDRFVIVTGDPDLPKRTAYSPQADRKPTNAKNQILLKSALRKIATL